MNDTPGATTREEYIARLIGEIRTYCAVYDPDFLYDHYGHSAYYRGGSEDKGYFVIRRDGMEFREVDAVADDGLRIYSWRER